MCDSKGVIYKGRKNIDQFKSAHAVETKLRTLSDAMKNADVFLGLSAKDVVSKDMVKSMAKNPIIFACANPDPEITPEEIEEVRDLAKSLGPIKVRIELNFSSESQVLPTGATIPDGFYKFLTFNDGSKKCYYFENQPTDRNWTEYEINCN